MVLSLLDLSFSILQYVRIGIPYFVWLLAPQHTSEYIPNLYMVHMAPTCLLISSAASPHKGALRSGVLSDLQFLQASYSYLPSSLWACYSLCLGFFLHVTNSYYSFSTHCKGNPQSSPQEAFYIICLVCLFHNNLCFPLS